MEGILSYAFATSRTGSLLTPRRSLEAQGRADVRGELLELIAKLDPGCVGDTDHPVEIRRHAGGVDHRRWTERRGHVRAGLGEGLLAVDDGRRERRQQRAMRDAALVVVIRQRPDVGARAFQLAARPEQPRMGAGSIEAVVQDGDLARDQLHLGSAEAALGGARVADVVMGQVMH